MTLGLYTLDDNYINFLRNYERKIYSNKKEKRPYVGIVLNVNGFDCFAPLSSPKEKHKTMKNKIDFVKMEQGELGVINLNNMIPACEEVAKKINVEKISDEQYKRLLINEIQFINRNYKKINQQAKKLHEKVTIYNSKLANRCCDFLLLEKLSKTYKETILEQRVIFIPRIQKGLDSEFIRETTGLRIEEVEELRKTNCNFIGIELDKSYFDIEIHRITETRKMKKHS